MKTTPNATVTTYTLLPPEDSPVPSYRVSLSCGCAVRVVTPEAIGVGDECPCPIHNPGVSVDDVAITATPEAQRANRTAILRVLQANGFRPQHSEEERTYYKGVGHAITVVLEWDADTESTTFSITDGKVTDGGATADDLVECLESFDVLSATPDATEITPGPATTEQRVTDLLGRLAWLPFREFTAEDWNAYAGCGSRTPRIAYADDLTVVVDGNMVEIFTVEGAASPHPLFSVTINEY